MRQAFLAILFGLTGISAAGAASPGFDFYVLSLSWSPSYCETEGRGADPQQCRAAKPFGFIVHGLWPQRERGYADNCATQEREVPRERMRGLYDIMPSAGLIRHEWRRHGSCSGLSQAEYFATLRRAREAVTVPAQFRQVGARRNVAPREVERAFATSNAGLATGAIAVACEDGLLAEVRICLTKELAFRPCPEIDRRGCKASQVAMPPVGN